VPDELEKSEGENQEADGPEQERPTVSPPFDPAAFAREVLSKPSPATGTPAVTADAHTHATPPHGVQQQAVVEMSRASKPPDETTDKKPGGILPEPPDRSPDSIGPLAAQKLPSNEMPRIDIAKPKANEDGPKRTESFSSMNALDRGWAELEYATRPPPADAPDEDPILEVTETTPRDSLVDLDEVDGDFRTEERPTAQRESLPNLPATSSPPISTGEEEPLPGGRTPTPAPVTVKPSEREMNDRVSVGDYSGALEIAESILADNPNNVAAKACIENCRTVLRKMYAARIGPLDRVPVVAVPRDQLRWLSIDHKAGFVLSLVDGVSSLEMIIDVSGMPELDTLRILSELAQQRIISLK
jgi:hypothetical protein